MERNFGEASGKPVAAVRELITEGNVEGMEQDEEIVERCFTALQQVAAAHGDKRIIVSCACNKSYFTRNCTK